MKHFTYTSTFYQAKSLEILFAKIKSILSTLFAQHTTDCRGTTKEDGYFSSPLVVQLSKHLQDIKQSANMTMHAILVVNKQINRSHLTVIALSAIDHTLKWGCSVGPCILNYSCTKFLFPYPKLILKNIA